MIRDFTQTYFSDTISYFKSDFMSRWEQEEYNDPNKPAIFVGLYSNKDKTAFLNHKSYKILYFAGADFCHSNLKLVANTDLSKTICTGYGPDWLYPTLDKYGIPYSTTKILLKDYSQFTPTPLGENIYVYKGLHGDRADHYKWNQVVKPLQEVFGEDRIIYTQFLPLNELHEKYYNDCFIYIRPQPLGGGTAMFELGHMGRKTIAQQHSSFSTCLNYENLEDIINLIMEESKKIGTLQPQVAEELKSMFDHKGKWLNLNNYKKWHKEYTK
tara:strand:- start:248 stop:1057 length:810 start_codon:yes stop_codon:yes gene_type:complete